MLERHITLLDNIEDCNKIDQEDIEWIAFHGGWPETRTLFNNINADLYLAKKMEKKYLILKSLISNLSKDQESLLYLLPPDCLNNYVLHFIVKKPFGGIPDEAAAKKWMAQKTKSKALFSPTAYQPNPGCIVS
jgi:hypothetical protein